jgi:[ribosomal protein S5]-alanine N-acetyltransferase
MANTETPSGGAAGRHDDTRDLSLVFETERLRVRQFTFADLDAFAALCADPVVMRYVGDGSPLCRSDVADWILVCHDKYARRGYGTSAVVEKQSDRFVGYCGVVRAPGNDFDELIYVFGVDAWGKGYATEAARAMLDYVFSHSPLDRIYATIHPANTVSARVARKLGFRFERQQTDEDGQPVDFYVIGRPQ